MEKNENGFSGYNFGRSTNGRNGTCPGTGERWTPSGMGNSGCNGNGNGNCNGNGNGNGNGTVGGVMDGGMSCPGTDLGGSRQLAMVYSPYQCWRMLYLPDKALMRGTMFEELDKPLEECGNG